MSKTQKIIIWLLGIWSILLFSYNILAYHHTVDSLGFNFHWLSQLAAWIGVKPFPVNGLLGQFIFWSSVFLLVVVFIALLIISFYPRSRTQVNLEESTGKLELSKSAVEGLVKTVVQEQAFMRNPSVSAKMYKDKMKLDIKGGIIPRVGAAEKAKHLEEQIVNNLQEFIGLDHPLKLKVIVTDTEEQKQTKNTSAPRVL
ncbi:alkaline shock response membrane anchor protein AmaP [Streptococcus merionis]|uniref:alkaline shock response membrane anchor protein AmaP n=1 Tax=Streptococcus merionis TaxID=400065 RepID=UPI003514E44F